MHFFGMKSKSILRFEFIVTFIALEWLLSGVFPLMFGQIIDMIGLERTSGI